RTLQLLDYLLFPGFRRQSIVAPIYIVANPRSGTTFLHRLMAADPRFVDTKLYQSLFPSVTFYYFINGLNWCDKKLGQPLYKVLVRPLGRWMFQEWEGLHTTGLEHSEEDEAYWIYPLLTPTLLIFFPFFAKLRKAVFVDEQPESVRHKARCYLQRQLQRLLYVHGNNRTLLAKNAAAAGRIKTYLDVMPDMRVVHIYRHPCQSIASALSMFSQKPWQVLAPKVAGSSAEMKDAAELWCQHYLRHMQLREELPGGRYFEVAYDDLVNNPGGVLRNLYAHFSLEMSAEFEAHLDEQVALMKNYRSSHDYRLSDFGIDEEWIYQRLQPAFEAYGFSKIAATD
ncbi:MAG: sulfotransferase, partial [Pseudomonadales bacterium]|nr:sulfotransferase [Pseudomonadales bacterium]